MILQSVADFLRDVCREGGGGGNTQTAKSSGQEGRRVETLEATTHSAQCKMK